MLQTNSKLQIGTAVEPTLEIANENPNEVKAILLDKGNTRYYFSNEYGHKVIAGTSERPMRKKEYKKLMDEMVEYSSSIPDGDVLLDELIKLDFGTGHAKSTFNVLMNWPANDPNGVRIFVKDTERFIYNVENKSVYKIAPEKHISGMFIESPEKEEVIGILNRSKTIRKQMK